MAVKISIKPGTISKATSTQKSAPAKNPALTAAGRQSGGGRGPVLFVVIGACLLIVVIAAVSSQVGTRRNPVQQNITVHQTAPAAPAPSSKFNELDGKSIGQWMKDNHTDNNAMVKERTKRRQEFTYGK